MIDRVATSSVRGVLFAKDMQRVAGFYQQAIGMKELDRGDDHARLANGGFELIVHQVPEHIAREIRIDDPPTVRVSGAFRLDYVVASLEDSRRIARSLGGDIEESPPPWADSQVNFFLGHDPEGNRFGVSQS